MFQQYDLGQVYQIEAYPWYAHTNILVGPHSPSNRHQYPMESPTAETFKYWSLLSAPLPNKNTKPRTSYNSFASYSQVNSMLNRMYAGVSSPLPPIGLTFSGS